MWGIRNRRRIKMTGCVRTMQNKKSRSSFSPHVLRVPVVRMLIHGQSRLLKIENWSHTSALGIFHFSVILSMTPTIPTAFHNKDKETSNLSMEGRDDVPSPPPFYRVSGHFTVLNPSRPMALAKLLESTTTLQSTGTDSFSRDADVPGLVGDNTSDIDDFCNDYSNLEWPNLDNIFAYSVNFPPSEEDVSMATPDSEKNNTSSHANIDENTKSSLMIPQKASDSTAFRTIQTPEGLALLLQDQTRRSPFSEQRPRRNARWTLEEDDLLRVAVELEQGPPHNWKLIAEKYFGGTRNALACKGRWNKVSTPMKPAVVGILYFFHALISVSSESTPRATA